MGGKLQVGRSILIAAFLDGLSRNNFVTGTRYTVRVTRKTFFSAAALLALPAALLVSKQTGLFSTLDSQTLLGKQKEPDTWLVTTNQLLRPWGQQVAVKGRPVEIAFDSLRQNNAVLNWRGVEVFDGTTGASLGTASSRATSYTGLAYRPGDREIWASEVTRHGPDGLLVVTLDDKGKPVSSEHIKLEGHPVPAGIVFSPEGNRAYVALTGHNAVGVFDASARKMQGVIDTGSVPYGVAMAVTKRRIYVTNRGGRIPRPDDTVAWSANARVATNPETGATSTGTVTVIDLAENVNHDVEVGLAPAGIAISPDEEELAVANAHSDSVTFIKTSNDETQTVSIPSWPEKTFGSQPAGVAWSPDGKRVYVAAGGINAIAVLERKDGKWALAGAIPAGWFPTAVGVDSKGALRVVNVKGYGNTVDSNGTFNSKNYEGLISQIPAPTPAQLQNGLSVVKAASQPAFTAQGGVADLAKLGIQHVFLIVKENRTYDQVLGDLPRGNNDPKLVMYGREVSPNHHALAEQFVQLDNFYTGGAISFDGHQWLLQGFVSDYVERSLTAAPRGYAWNLSDALTVSPAGFFWQHSPRPLDVRLYGAFSLPARWDPEKQRAVDINEDKLLKWTEYWKMYKENSWRGVIASRCGVPALQGIYESQFPPNETNLTDQMRAEAWADELAKREKSGRMPNLVIITTTSDHTNGTDTHSPTPRAMVADNDYALGRIVEGITKSRFWPKSLILVTEDDAQDGIDHVDGHRTIGLAISPYIRRGVLDSNHYNHSSMIRTIQQVFGIPPKTRVLATARAMNSIFQPKPDLTPYKALPPNIKLDEMNPPLKSLRGRQLWAARQSNGMNWKDIDDVPSALLNRILWWDSKGYDKPVPKRQVKRQ
jgi:DNA-binding beta-propeller fold protein YncE